MQADDPQGDADGGVDSPFPASGPPPSDDPSWVKGMMPDGQEVWVSQPRNMVERLGCVLVLDRRSNSSRYCCTKCGLTFVGTKKRVKEHLRRIKRDIKPCTVELTAAEEEVLKQDDALLNVRSGLKKRLGLGTDLPAPVTDQNGVPLQGRKLKERFSELALEADMAWFKLFERYGISNRIVDSIYPCIIRESIHPNTHTHTDTHTHIYVYEFRHDIPKRIIESDEMREAVRKTVRAGASYVLPSRSRMGDDTPGHKADPTQRGAKARSKPPGLMYLALQTLQQEERAMARFGGGGGGGGGGMGAGGGLVDGGITDDGVVDAGLDCLGVGMGVGMGMGMGGMLGGKMRKRANNKISNRLLDRKSVLLQWLELLIHAYKRECTYIHACMHACMHT